MKFLDVSHWARVMEATKPSFEDLWKAIVERDKRINKLYFENIELKEYNRSILMDGFTS